MDLIERPPKARVGRRRVEDAESGTIQAGASAMLPISLMDGLQSASPNLRGATRVAERQYANPSIGRSVSAEG